MSYLCKLNANRSGARRPFQIRRVFRGNSMGKLEHLPFEFETAETMLHLLGPGVVGCGRTTKRFLWRMLPFCSVRSRRLRCRFVGRCTSGIFGTPCPQLKDQWDLRSRKSSILLLSCLHTLIPHKFQAPFCGPSLFVEPAQKQQPCPT